ncbi:putative RDD family membrane protein YckC [Streptomyces sp. SAI-117]|uniref:RDD family protein n=1 Tax=Streptomyces sp. SAI-117 TaxID=2940546 RepID=UPI0024742179|nr:RDD family protein [Streptomyces sp. SAI-117]MDH6566333.1 putative RDD family membrane protein YckC [Streptomyces sp. SAI-117]
MTAPSRTRRPPEIQGRPAGLVSRTVAAAVDAFVVLAILLALQSGYAAARSLLTGQPFALPDPGPGFTVAFGYTVLVAYLVGGWVLGGRTAGDQLMGLRVTAGSGRRLTAGTALFRAVLCVVLPVGLLWIPVSRRAASLQDVVTGSAVVHDWYGGTHGPPAGSR